MEEEEEAGRWWVRFGLDGVLERVEGETGRKEKEVGEDLKS